MKNSLKNFFFTVVVCFLNFFYFLLFILLQLSSCPNSFFAFCPLHPVHPSCPQSILSPLSMSMNHSYMFFDSSLPLPSTILPSHLPFYSCQSVPCFHVSGSIFFISLFCSLDSSYKWGHMVLVFHQLAYCYTITVSSSIHAITKVRIPFFKRFLIVLKYT